MACRGTFPRPWKENRYCRRGFSWRQIPTHRPGHCFFTTLALGLNPVVCAWAKEGLAWPSLELGAARLVGRAGCCGLSPSASVYEPG